MEHAVCPFDLVPISVYMSYLLGLHLQKILYARVMYLNIVYYFYGSLSVANKKLYSM